MSYRLQDAVWVRTPLAGVFAFFADARNLEALTPRWLRFQILTPGAIPMGVGTRIDYRLRLHGIPFSWQTEITVWDPPHGFVDVQRRGPYRFWRHHHTFDTAGEGTLCRDDVEYAVPGGALIHRLFVQRDVKAIFAFRRAAIARRFGGVEGISVTAEPPRLVAPLGNPESSPQG